MTHVPFQLSKKILTVSELTFQIKSQLEIRFKNISVEGEISNLKHQSSGHMYFSLKDENSQISCVLFKGNSRNLSRLPKSGDKITIKGEISVYAPRGNYQIIVRELTYAGTGELLLKLHKLKEELKNRGWFEKEHKKPLPPLPKTIGVVTSPTGAVIQDILHVLSRRFSGFHLLLNPVKVQGEGAAEEIAKAIDDFNKYRLADILIIGRGGGSLEDLWAFNEEIVAKAIFESNIPIISAVGHETDTSIADYVADIRAPTPSAAAEIAIKEKQFLLDTLNNYRQQTKNTLLQQIRQARQNLLHFKKQSVFSSAYTLLGTSIQRIDDIQLRLDQSVRYLLLQKKEKTKAFFRQTQNLNPLKQLSFSKEKLLRLKQNIHSAWKSYINLQREKFNKDFFLQRLDQIMQNLLSHHKERTLFLHAHLSSLNPQNLLKKGYSILFSEKKDSIILSCKQVKKDQKLSAQLSDGMIDVTIENVKSYE